MLPNDFHVRIAAALPPARRQRLTQAAAVAAERGWPLFLVGGFVRDVLLGVRPDDFDLVVEGPAVELARALSRRFGGSVVVHSPFGTATWTTPDGLAIDLATARTEVYPRPAALPVVSGPALIEADLGRRDFSINALAVRWTPDGPGELLDRHGGVADLADRTIRVLHAASFLDDPTRLFRAVRYEQRLGGSLDAGALALAGQAGEALAALSPDRVRHEFEAIFRESRAALMLARLGQLGILRQVHAGLAWGPAESEMAAAWASMPWNDWRWEPAPEPDAPWLALLLRGATPRVRAEALHRLNASRAVATAVDEALDLEVASTPPSAVVAALDGVSGLGLAAAYLARPKLRLVLDRYLASWRFVRAEITGHDLLELGLTPGPDFKVWLWRLRAARLDGLVSDRAGEAALLDGWLAGDHRGAR